jgi:hypothetical protein
MRIHFLVPSLVAAGLLSTCLSAQAQQFSTVAEVLRECPDLDRAIACPAVAQAFVSPPNFPNDTQIVTLVGALAAAGQLPRVPLPVCLNTADGLRVLATHVGGGTGMQIRDIADSLCLGVRTAAIPAGDSADDDDGDNGGNGGAIVVNEDGNGGTNGGNGGANGGNSGTNGGNGGNGGTNGGNGGTNGGNGGDNGGDDNGGNGGDNGGDDNGGNGGDNGGDDNGGNGGDDHDDNGHGNDDDHDDDSNPGQGGGGGGGDDGNNGHGNDDDHDDDSNPGQGGQN